MRILLFLSFLFIPLTVWAQELTVFAAASLTSRIQNRMMAPNECPFVIQQLRPVERERSNRGIG
jgi:hypothetical protein